MTASEAGQKMSDKSRSKSRVRVAPSYWTHNFVVPFSEDVQPASLFLKNRYFLVLDIETQRIAQDVGGWGNIEKLGVSVACAYDSKTEKMHSFRESEMGELIKLCRDRLIVGYNVIGFDLKVLAPYGLEPKRLDVFDMMVDIELSSGWRYVKLDNIAKATLGHAKIADGLQAVEWYKEGKIDQIIEYCIKDVEITRDIFLHGMKTGGIKIAKADGSMAEINVQWT